MVAPDIIIDPTEGLFASKGLGTPADNPSDPKNLTDFQASRAVQIFFRPEKGWIDAVFKITYSGAGDGEGRNVLFSGDTGLCEPPSKHEERELVERVVGKRLEAARGEAVHG